MLISKFLIHTPLLQVLSDILIFTTLATMLLPVIFKRLRYIITEIRAWLKQLYSLPYAETRKPNPWIYAFASGFFILFSLYFVFEGSSVFLFVLTNADLEITKKIVGYAFYPLMIAVAAYYRVEAERAWYYFRHGGQPPV